MRSGLRKEIKYIIPKIEFLRLKKHLEALMRKDSHCSDGSYMVRSQYYDSLRDQDLRDNVDGNMEKRKIRLRTYTLDASKIKLEYKCKSNSEGTKYAIWISREEAAMMESGKYGFLLDHEEELAKILYVKMMQGAYRAKTIIQYNRMAYIHHVCNFRITFDTDLKSTLNPHGLFSKELSFVPLIEGDRGIMEVKYNEFLPSVFKGLLQEIDALQEASSKYSMSRRYV